MRYSLLSLGGVCAILLAASAWPGVASPVANLRVLHHFGEDDGEYPDTDLVMDGDGNLYGMTVQGGDFNSGTVFRLSPTPTGWEESVLYSFTSGADGGQSYGGVTLDAQGNIYGTTVVGGSWTGCPEDGCGVVWKLTKNGDDYTHSVLHAFQAGESDGQGPGGPVSFDAQGNLYGMTPLGGDFNAGTIFKLSPTPAGPWNATLIHEFTGGIDGGSASKARLIFDNAGNMYGVATTGGAFGVGTVFRLSPDGLGGWDFDTLYSFKGQPDGIFPYGGLLRDNSGTLYGTTYYGGTADRGVVYQLQEVAGVWTPQVLHHFQGGQDGSYPISALVRGNDGALYGTTSTGGGPGSHGTIFRVIQGPTGAWRTRVVHAFTGLDGELPYSGLLKGPQGDLFGTAVNGGEDGDGTVFRFTP